MLWLPLLFIHTLKGEYCSLRTLPGHAYFQLFLVWFYLQHSLSYVLTSSSESENKNQLPFNDKVESSEGKLALQHVSQW